MWTNEGFLAATYGCQPSNVGTPVKGEFYYDVKTKTYHVYDGSKWCEVGEQYFEKKKPTIEELAERFPAVKEAKERLDFLVTMVMDHE